MARTSEKAFNGLLAQALDRRHPRWDVNAEQTGVIAGSAGKVPDIVITPDGGRAGVPVVIETEYHPARTVEVDAIKRLGLVLAGLGRTVGQVVALSIPESLQQVSQRELPAEIESAEYRYRLVTGDAASGNEHVSWFPKSGWLTGSVDELVGLCELIVTNELEVERAAADMERTVSEVSLRLTRSAASTQRVLADIAATLNLKTSEQTTRIGMTMIANALLFQLAIEGDEDANTGWRVPGPSPDDTRSHVLAVWSKILDINYWPIFFTASAVLEQIPQVQAATDVLPPLTEMAQRLARWGAMSTSDMAGQMFGKLIADRKFLATFYTRRESARLLAELAVARLQIDWSDPEPIRSLKVADLACGTGALLAATYDRIASRVRRAGMADDTFHPVMMESVLVGADIMPAAVHLTCTALSSLHPQTRFKRSSIHKIPFGRVPDQKGGGFHTRIGSLELLHRSYHQTNWLDTAEVTVTPTYIEDENTSPILNHMEADLVIMNPPFTRPTNHATEAAADVPVPSFAGFGTDDEAQEYMKERLVKLSPSKRAGHGNVGLGSNFFDLAHVKIKRGGTIAFVLPLTVVSGVDWVKVREVLSKYYKDILVVSISATGTTESAFSADTGMAEVLIVATRRELGESITNNDFWVTLDNRPLNPVEAIEVARQIMISNQEKRRTGTLCIGDAKVGSFAHNGFSEGSGYVGLSNFSLADCGEAMMTGGLWMPRLHGIDMTDVLVALKKLGSSGPIHRDINGYTGKPHRSPPRGPFDVEQTTAWKAAEYPMLWAHNAKRETRLIVEPDSQGKIREGMESKAKRIWNTRSRLHFNLDFRLNSQPLAACFTTTQCIGGTAWPSFSLNKPRWEPAILSWANTTLGLIAFWWLGSRQQRGRARLSITRLPELPVLNPDALTSEQLSVAQVIFDRFKDKKFLPANEAYHDATRIALDEAVLIEMLGLQHATDFTEDEIMESLEVLREQWCREPSVHGGKNTRPA